MIGRLTYNIVSCIIHHSQSDYILLVSHYRSEISLVWRDLVIQFRRSNDRKLLISEHREVIKAQYQQLYSEQPLSANSDLLVSRDVQPVIRVKIGPDRLDHIARAISLSAKYLKSRLFKE